MDHDNNDDKIAIGVEREICECEDNLFQTVITRKNNLTHNSQNSYQSAAVVFYQILPVSLLRIGS